MFKDVEDIERSWRSLKVERSSYCNILHAMMTKVCVTVCAKCLIFFTPPNMIGDDWSAAQGTQKVTLPSVWTATLSGALGLIAPLEQDEMQSNDIQWVWCFGLMLTWVWYLSQGLILALNKTRRNPMRTSQSYAARLTGSVNTSFARFSSPEVAPIPDYWSPVNDTQRHLQTIL